MINISEEKIMATWRNHNKPLVTIRCTTYNQEKYIEKAIEGFLIQKTTFPFEIFIHDDASTDKTPSIIKQYQEKYPHIIRVIYEKENQYSKNDGSLRRILNANCRGKYTALCEGDDYWTSPNKLQKQISFMESNANCSMTFHAVNYEENGLIIKNDRRYYKECNANICDIIEGGGFFCATVSLCVRTKDLFEMPKYRQIALVGDYPLQVMLATKGIVHYFPQIMGVYRVSALGSWSEGMQSSKNIEKYASNGIQWLTEFNKCTNYKFSDSVNDRIIDYRYFLYTITSKESMLKLVLDVLKLRKKRLYYILRIIKASIRKHMPIVFNVYHNFKGNLK